MADQFDHLFPVRFLKAFTTAPQHASLSNVEYVVLGDEALRVSRVGSGFSRSIVPAPGAAPGTKAWEALYAAGSYKPSALPRGGFSFYLAGPVGFALADATEAVVSYAVKFEDGFLFKCVSRLCAAWV